MDTDLDSYIKDKGIKYPGRGGRGGRGRGGNQGRGGNFGGNRGSGNFGGRQSGGMIMKRTQPSLSAGSSLHISNLDFGVSNQDIGELFGEFGDIRRFAVHFDQSGRSIGTAEVHYLNPSSAMRAMRKYNGVPLDGRPMRIEISGTVGQSMGGGGFANRMPSGGRGGFRSGNDGRGFGGGRGSGGGGFRGTRGAARGRGGSRRPPPPSKEDLDAELETLTKAT
ncbi:THO complex subunit 4-like [Symsagittifera roscoffensis]|uniref:THO complex subunit 4-like n=1 Tax=Symsagittifera roscoffensis TaxID=84072 RepID=UPI00307BD71D